MSDRSEILELITNLLDAKKGKGKSKAPASPAEINGIRIVDEPKRAAGRPKKAVPVADRSASPPPTPRPVRAPRAKSPAPEEPKAYPKPSSALALKRSSARPMPHKCDCPLCPLKN